MTTTTKTVEQLKAELAAAQEALAVQEKEARRKEAEAQARTEFAATAENLKASTLQRMMAEILDDINKGVVPATVATFSELHDYVDANEYGGFCDDATIVALSVHFGGTDPETGEMPQGLVAFANECQGAVDVWLLAGRQASQSTAVAQAYMGRRIAVANKITMLNRRLNDIDKEVEVFPDNWCFAGSMGRVEEQLQELLEFLG